MSGCIVIPANSPGYSQRSYGQPYASPPMGKPYGQPTAPPNAAPPAADELDFGYYQTQLGPYGDWVDIPDNGQCWVPTEVKVNPAWRPYMDNGKWDYTDQGWFWTSEYPWGEIVFHYGRWISHPQYHWAWVPGFDWAPAWVAWRDDQSDGAVAWAPLPPAAQFQAGVGLEYDGQPADTANVDFGLAPADFVFVGSDHFGDSNLRSVVIAPEQVPLFYAHSVVQNNYAVVGDKVFVGALGSSRMASLTHHPLRMLSVQSLKANQERQNADRRHIQNPSIPKETKSEHQIRKIQEWHGPGGSPHQTGGPGGPPHQAGGPGGPFIQKGGGNGQQTPPQKGTTPKQPQKSSPQPAKKDNNKN